MKQVFVVISEIDKWEIELFEDDIKIGDTLHYKPENEGDEPRTIMDGEYMWDGNKIQVDSDGKVIMINGQTAEVELKKHKMEKSKKVNLLGKVNEWFAKNDIQAKAVDTDGDKKDDTQTPERDEVVAKLRAFAKEEFGEERAEKFVDVTLADGTVAVIEPDVEAGAAMVLMDSEGNPVPAPASSYELEDGRVIVVEEPGVIASVQEAPAADEDMDKDEPTVDDQPNEEQKVKRIIESIVQEKVFVKSEDFEAVTKELAEEKKLTAFLKKENEDVLDKYEELREAFVNLQKFSKEIFEELLAEPSKEPAVKNKNPLAKEPKENIFFTKPFVTTKEQ